MEVKAGEMEEKEGERVSKFRCSQLPEKHIVPATITVTSFLLSSPPLFTSYVSPYRSSLLFPLLSPLGSLLLFSLPSPLLLSLSTLHIILDSSSSSHSTPPSASTAAACSSSTQTQ